MVEVSVRIDKELKDRLDRLGINLSEVVSGLLEEYVKKAELEELSRILDELKAKLAGKISPELVVRLIREEREAR